MVNKTFAITPAGYGKLPIGQFRRRKAPAKTIISPPYLTLIRCLKLKNPPILASGILDEAGSAMAEIGKQAGAVVTKSIGLQPREGYGNPAVLLPLSQNFLSLSLP